jgi:hypothetical protein
VRRLCVRNPKGGLHCLSVTIVGRTDCNDSMQDPDPIAYAALCIGFSAIATVAEPASGGVQAKTLSSP